MADFEILIFGDITRKPFINNLAAPAKAFERLANIRIVEPYLTKDFKPTGGAVPAPVPEHALIESLDGFDPDIVICLGGGLYVPPSLRRLFKVGTIFAGFALSDPLGIEVSLEIAREFDLFYTQDPQCVDVYLSHGINASRCDPAIDSDLYRPLGLKKDCDVLFYGKWTSYRDEILKMLNESFHVNVYAYRGETRWSIPTLEPLDTPQELCEAINRSRLTIEFAVLDDLTGNFKGTSRITNRAQFAAACGIPCLIDDFDRLPEFFEPGTEIMTYRVPEELLLQTRMLLADEQLCSDIGRHARARVLRDQTWEVRANSFLSDVRRLRSIRSERQGVEP